VERSLREASTVNIDRAATTATVRALYDDHARDIHAYAARRVGSDLADDIVADTFRHAIESFESFDPDRGSERVWLFGIATNLLRRHWRTEQRRRSALHRMTQSDMAGFDGDPLLTVPGRIDGASDAARVLVAVAELSVEDYELLVLVAWEQMSRIDVAEVLGIPPGTVRSRLHRIRRRLDASRRRDFASQSDPEGMTP
jgi:RNA polymerase sigma factor (sigma-70 family)